MEVADLAEAAMQTVVEVLAPWRSRYPQVEAVENTIRGHPVKALAQASDGADLVVVAARGHSAARLGAASLNGPTSPHRRWSWTRADLTEVRRISEVFGGTVNDVVLAAVARGFRDLLGARDVLGAGTVVRTMVPVSVRLSGERGVLTNRVSAVLVSLPCGEPDAVRRLRLIREQSEAPKVSHQALGPEVFEFVGEGLQMSLLVGAVRSGRRWPGRTASPTGTFAPAPASVCTDSRWGVVPPVR